MTQPNWIVTHRGRYYAGYCDYGLPRFVRSPSMAVLLYAEEARRICNRCKGAVAEISDNKKPLPARSQ